MNRLRLQNLAGEHRCQFSEGTWLRKVAPVWGSRCQSFGCLYYVGSVDVTGSYAEDTAMTLHQDFSAHVPAGGSTYGGFMDSLSVIPTHEVLGNCRSE